MSFKNVIPTGNSATQYFIRAALHHNFFNFCENRASLSGGWAANNGTGEGGFNVYGELKVVPRLPCLHFQFLARTREDTQGN